MTRIIRPLRSGQITIPADFRKMLDITKDSVLQINLVEGELRLKPLHIPNQEASGSWLQSIYKQFAPIRDEAKEYSEKEINDAIDQAVSSVRKSHV